MLKPFEPNGFLPTVCGLKKTKCLMLFKLSFQILVSKCFVTASIMLLNFMALSKFKSPVTKFELYTVSIEL